MSTEGPSLANKPQTDASGGGSPRSPNLTVEALRDPSISLRDLRKAQLSDDPQVRRAAAVILRQRLMARQRQQPLNLAADPATPGDVLIKLAGHSSATVRQRVLRNPSLPQDFLEALRQLLAGQPLDETALIALARSGPWVQRRVLERAMSEVVFAAVAENGGADLVARHPQSPPAILEQLAEQAALQRLLAVHPKTPPRVLARFARSQEGSLRARVARNPALDIRSMVRLATDSDWEVREALAANPALTEEAIRLLAQDHWNEEIGLSLVDQRRIPAEILAQMAEWPNARLRRKAARHSKASAEVLSRLAGEADFLVRLEVAAHFATPADVRGKLAQDPHPLVRLAARGGELRHKNPALRRAALLSPALPAEAVAAAASDPDPFVQRLAVAHPSCPQQVRDQVVQTIPGLASNLGRLYRALSGETERGYDRSALLELRTLAASPQTPPRVLIRLHQHGHPFLLEALVCNPRTPPGVLEALAHDLDYREMLERRDTLAPEVRQRIEMLDAFEAAQPLDPRRLKRFLASASDAVRQALAGNPELPAAAKRTLAFDPSAEVRSVVAARNDLEGELIEILAGDREPSVVRNILARQELSPEALTVLARSSLPEAWERVLTDPNTPEDALQLLLPHRKLWPSLSAHPRSPAALLEALYQRAGSALGADLARHPHASARLLRQIARPLMGLRWRLLYGIARRLPLKLETRRREQEELLRTIRSHKNCPKKLRARIGWWLDRVLESRG